MNPDVTSVLLGLLTNALSAIAGHAGTRARGLFGPSEDSTEVRGFVEDVIGEAIRSFQDLEPLDELAVSFLASPETSRLVERMLVLDLADESSDQLSGEFVTLALAWTNGHLSRGQAE